MANEIATAFVGLVPSLQGGRGAITRELSGAGAKAGDEAGKATGKKFGGAFVGGLKGLAGPVAGVFAAVGALNFLKDATAGAEEANSVARVSQAIIKSTGGVAKVTSRDLDNLTASLMRKTAVDDDEIRKGANLLLTFKNVRNEVGRGNKIFNRATTAALDLSKAGFGSLDSTSKQLGKALNDPLKGITALSRAGVTFTAGQQKRIEGLVEEGDLLSAQKIILKEVESQVGGTAAASATASQKIAAQWGEIKESIGGLVLPLLESLAPVFERLAPVAQKAIEGLAPVFAKVGPFIEKLATGIGSLFSGFSGGGGAGFMSFLRSLGEAFKVVAPAVMGFVRSILPPLRQLGAQIMAVVGPALRDLGVIIKTQVAPALAAFLPAVAPIVKFLIGFVGQQLVGALKGAVQVVKGVFQVIAGVLNVFAGLFTGDWSRLWKGVKQIAAGVWSALKGSFRVLLNVGILRAFSVAGKALLGLARSAWSSLSGVFSRGIARVIGLVRDIPGKATRALSGIGDALRNAGRRLIDGLVRGIREKISAVTGAVGDVMDAARRLLPSSPAKEGPFSGKGWTLYSGRAISESLAQGMVDRTAMVAAASNRLATSAYPNVAGVGTPAAGGLATPQVRVFIGDQELRGMVRVEVGESNRGIRRQVMAGARGWA